MKVYCQFKVLSTGYVPNSIPPQFKEDFKKPIDMLGSDSVYILDGRKNIDSLIIDSRYRLDKINRCNSIIGFDIISSDSFSNIGKVVYSSESLF